MENWGGENVTPIITRCCEQMTLTEMDWGVCVGKRLLKEAVLQQNIAVKNAST